VAQAPQTPAAAPAAPADPTFYAVTYVEVMAPASAKAIAALKQYREASRKNDGYVRVEFLEQVGRPGHFVVVETWRDQKAFDARAAADQKPLMEALQPIRVSGYDQRPYKTLTVGPPPPAPNGRAVVVIAHVDVTPGTQPLVILRRVADASRQEPGNVRFDVMQHMMRANHFTVVETWRDQKAFDEHLAAAHTKQYRDEVQPLTGSPLDERLYKAVD
jgi:autoinducer 2-degrading protein